MEKDQYLSALSSGNGKTPFHSFKNDESNGGVCRCLVIYISQSLQEPMATSKAPIEPLRCSRQSLPEPMASSKALESKLWPREKGPDSLMQTPMC